MAFRSRRSRIGGLAGLGILALALNGCSPGSMSIAASNGAGDHLVVSVNCTAVLNSRGSSTTAGKPLPKNCTGVAIGRISGQLITVRSLSGGFTNLDNPSQDCVSAPCAAHTQGDLFGLTSIAGQPTLVEIEAQDNHSTTGAGPDLAALFLIPISSGGSNSSPTPVATFTCASCVTIHMQPGSISFP